MTSYRIQLEARRTFDGSNARYDRVRGLGALTSSYVAGKGLYRVLVGEYYDLSEAQAAQGSARSAGYPEAFVVRYEGEVYQGRVR